MEGECYHLSSTELQTYRLSLDTRHSRHKHLHSVLANILIFFHRHVVPAQPTGRELVPPLVRIRRPEQTYHERDQDVASSGLWTEEEDGVFEGTGRQGERID
jgi:hypothetical protein